MFKEKNILHFAKRGNGKAGLKKSSAGFFKALASGFISSARSLPAHSPLIPYAFPAKLTLSPRSVETSGRELRRISETSGKVIYSCLILISYIVKSYFYSKRSRWGEKPRFTGKSPPCDIGFFSCTDFPCM